MPLNTYGVLKGHAIESRLGTGQSPHYQVRLVDETADYRIAINVASAVSPSELEFIVVDNFQHPITDQLEPLVLGFTLLDSRPGTGALDLIRGNLFDRSVMRILPFSVPGLDNDLNEKLDHVIQRAMSDEEAQVYAFGQRWGPEPAKKDRYFGFLPGNGIHDIHMNRSNVGEYMKDDGVWQDGGLMVHFPRQQQWTAVFLKFQSQGWHTDDQTGHKIEGADALREDNRLSFIRAGLAEPAFLPTTNEPQGLLRIVAAMINPTSSPEVEWVTLLNTAPHVVSVEGWHILDQDKNSQPLRGSILPGETWRVQLHAPVQLSNQGGIITVVDEQGLKVDGVAYTREQAAHVGWTLCF